MNSSSSLMTRIHSYQPFPYLWVKHRSKYTAFVAVSEELPVSKDTKENKSSLKAQNNNQSVPEPSEIIGNLLALICLVLFLTRKRWHHLLKVWLSK